MDDFSRCNKCPGVLWLKEPLEKLTIKVVIKYKNNIKLSHYEDFINNANGERSSSAKARGLEEYTFEWQEKVFATWQLQRYSDKNNCITDYELSFNEKINEDEVVHQKVFTYIDTENYLPTPFETRSITKPNFMGGLSNLMDKLNIGGKLSNAFREDTSSVAHLFRSEENIADGKQEWTSMHIVLDNSEYHDTGQLLIRDEAVLLSIHYNCGNKYLIVSPNENNLDWNPYDVTTSSGAFLNYQYAVSLEMEKPEDDQDLEILLRALSSKVHSKSRSVLPPPPPPGRARWLVCVDVLAGSGFDGRELYVQFHVKFPDSVSYSGESRGRTHVSKGSNSEFNFAHTIEMFLETDSHIEPPQIRFFFEVISIDGWERHRTEGYAFLPLTLKPGFHTHALTCLRAEERDKLVASERRFFVGGCHLLKDLEVLARPLDQDPNFAFTSTGTLSLRTSVCRHSCHTSEARVRGPGGDSAAIIEGAREAIQQYAEAAKELARATKYLVKESHSKETEA